jgi:hypothetical protein
MLCAFLLHSTIKKWISRHSTIRSLYGLQSTCQDYLGGNRLPVSEHLSEEYTSAHTFGGSGYIRLTENIIAVAKLDSNCINCSDYVMCGFDIRRVGCINRPLPGRSAGNKYNNRDQSCFL